MTPGHQVVYSLSDVLKGGLKPPCKDRDFVDFVVLSFRARISAHGPVGRQINLPGGPIELFFAPASGPQLV